MHTLPDPAAHRRVDGFPEGTTGDMELPVAREDRAGEDSMRVSAPALAQAPKRSERRMLPQEPDPSRLAGAPIPETALSRRSAMVRKERSSPLSPLSSSEKLPEAKIETALDWTDPASTKAREMPEEQARPARSETYSMAAASTAALSSPSSSRKDLDLSKHKKRTLRSQPEMAWKEAPALARRSMLQKIRPYVEPARKPLLSESPKATYRLPETERTLHEGTMDFMPPRADRSDAESRKLLALNFPTNARRPLQAQRDEDRRPLESPVPEIIAKPSLNSALNPPEPMRFEESLPLIKPYAHDAPPTYFGIEIVHRKIIFCLDVSGSMEWNNRIEDARQELLRLLDSLDERVEFNILTFSGRVRIWNRRGVQPANAENLESAKRFVRRARIASDGTNTVDALTAALSHEDAESVYLLSDGHPTVGFTTDSRRILRHVKELQRNRGVIIHTIAYIKGDPPREWRDRVPPKSRLIYLMEQLAEQNGGHSVVFDDQ
jgi:hypothetical protein